MLFEKIYRLLVKMGMEADPRGFQEVQKVLERRKEEFEEIKEKNREDYDTEKLVNPYDDTRILYGDKDLEIESVMAGIDIESAEILLADRLRERGEKVDMLLSHHPEGKALASLYEVMHLQEDVLSRAGVPINVAEGILAGRISEVQRGLLPINHNRAVDTARLLNIPFMCAHTPADNLVANFLQKKMEKENPRTVGRVVELLKEIPEFKAAAKINAGPKIIVGSDKRRAGKVLVDMTGGTSGSKEAYAKLVQAGVGTVVAMHMSDSHRKEAEKNHINVVIAGHMASDSLGMNLLLDKLEKEGIDILTCSGLIRVRRWKE